MGWTSPLVACLGLLCIAAGGTGAHVAWVTGEKSLEAPREGHRVPRNAGTATPGAHMLELSIESDITFRYSRTSIKCVLINNHNVANQIAFRTTLPKAAFISSFHIDVGGHRHVGEVKSKAEARRIYDAARAAGKTAAEVELSARDANLFTVNVNVQAHESVLFNLTYEELLVRRLEFYTHEVHIDPGQIVDDLHVQVTIEESNNVLDLQVNPVRPFDSTAHSGTHDEYDHEPLPTVTRPTAKSAIVEWRPTPEQQRNLRKDGVEGRFVVQYDIDRLSNPNQILVHDGYFVHFYAPADLTPMDKHVVFVLDTSGSMGGTRIQQLKEAMDRILSDLRKRDFFSIVEFSSHIKVWQGSGSGSVDMNLNSAVGENLVVKVTPDKVQEAKSFVQGLSVTGATNIHDSLTIALKIIEVGATKFSSMARRPEPMIIFLTDGDPNEGLVTDKAKIPEAIETTNTKLTSIFSLGFGKGIDMSFLRDLSVKNMGFARLIYEGSDAALQLEDFYREVSSPLLKDLKFRYTNVVKTTMTQIKYNTLQSGTELIMAGKLAGSPNNMRGALNAKSRYGSYSIGFAPPEMITLPVRDDFMERLWAYLNIRQLLEDPNNDDNKRKAQDMALKYSFVTPLTSLVVVRPDVVDPSTKIDSFVDERIANGEASDEGDIIEPIEPEDTDFELPEEPLIDNRQLVMGSEKKSSQLSWPGPQFNGTHVLITKGRKTKAYKVKANPTDENFADCRSLNGEWFHCRHVKSCILPLFIDDVKKYEKSYFCAIPGGFAGVCCPHG